jgi:hypothetical protein
MRENSIGARRNAVASDLPVASKYFALGFPPVLSVGK